MKRSILFICVLTLFFSCKEPQARRPVTQKTTNIYKETVAQSKKLNALENKIIAKYIAKDSLHTYIDSQNGFWYVYDHKIVDNLTFPKTEDVVTLQYDIQDLEGNIIYAKEELGIKKYKVGKQDFIPALQDGIKLMKPGETITFLIPSYRGFGVVGDEHKIGINQTLKSTVTLLNIN